MAKALIASLPVLVGLATLATPGALASSFEAESYPAAISGSVANDSFQFDSLLVECSSTSFNGELLEPSETLDLAPTFSHCTGLASSPAAVNMNGCVFRLHADQSGADLVCPTGQAMTVFVNPPIVGQCEVEVAAQADLDYVTSTSNEPPESPSTISVDFAIEGMSYSEGEATTACPLIDPGENGAYLGNPVLEGESESEAIGIAITGKTKLCEKEPVTTCADVYPASTLIEANEPVATLKLGTITIDCQSKLTATTIQKERAPLYLKDLALELTGCITNELVKCADPTVTRAFPSWISAFGAVGFDGALYIKELEVSLACGAEVKCKYSVKSMRFSIKNEKGAPRLFAASSLSKETIVGEVGLQSDDELVLRRQSRKTETGLDHGTLKAVLDGGSEPPSP